MKSPCAVLYGNGIALFFDDEGQQTDYQVWFFGGLGPFLEAFPAAEVWRADTLWGYYQPVDARQVERLCEQARNGGLMSREESSAAWSHL